MEDFYLQVICSKANEKKQKQSTLKQIPKLLSSLDVFTSEKGDVWKTKVLVRREHSTSKQVGLTHVIKEATDVAIETGIDAVKILRLWRRIKGKTQSRTYAMSEKSGVESCEVKTQSKSFFSAKRVFRIFADASLSQRADYLVVQAEEVRVVLPHLCFSFGDDFTYVPVWSRIHFQELISSCWWNSQFSFKQTAGVRWQTWIYSTTELWLWPQREQELLSWYRIWSKIKGSLILKKVISSFIIVYYLFITYFWAFSLVSAANFGSKSALWRFNFKNTNQFKT